MEINMFLKKKHAKHYDACASKTMVDFTSTSTLKCLEYRLIVHRNNFQVIPWFYDFLSLILPCFPTSSFLFQGDRCTLINDFAATTCSACGGPRGTNGTSGTTAVAADGFAAECQEVVEHPGSRRLFAGRLVFLVPERCSNFDICWD